MTCLVNASGGPSVHKARKWTSGFQVQSGRERRGGWGGLGGQLKWNSVMCCREPHSLTLHCSAGLAGWAVTHPTIASSYLYESDLAFLLHL